MENTYFVRAASLSLWFARRKDREQKAKYPYAQPYEATNCLRNFRHDMRNNTRDTARRGLSNREGAKNRSFRKHFKPAKVIFSCAFYDLVA